MRLIVSFIFTLLITTMSASAQANVDILKSKYAEPGVAESFKAGSDWYPYPAYSDRDGWDKLLTKEAKKAFIKKAEKKLGYKWQHIPASTWLTFNTSGDKQALRKIELKNREAL